MKGRTLSLEGSLESVAALVMVAASSKNSAMSSPSESTSSLESRMRFCEIKLDLI